MSQLADRLTLPLNPAHDVEADPGDQADLANPVTLNNYELVYTNAMIQVTQLSIDVNRKIEACKKARAEAEHQLEDLEEAVLRAHPAPTSANSVKKTQAWVAERAVEMELGGRRTELVALGRDYDQTLAGLKAEAWHCSLWIDAIKLGSQNMQTHLSYVKDERRRG